MHTKLVARERRRKRVRKKIMGTNERPRLSVFRSNHNIYAQLIDDLEDRLAAMVKKASRDQQEYSRNYARSQSEILRQREEGRKQLLALPEEDLLRLCTEFPGYLRNARSDIPQRLPEEFAAIYGKKSP